MTPKSKTRRRPNERRLAFLDEDVNEAVKHLQVEKTKAGLYRVTNPGTLPGVPFNVATGRTRAEAVARARRTVKAKRLRVMAEERFVRTRLLKGLNVMENPQGWRLSRKDFEVFLRRVSRLGLPVFGIEGWGDDVFPAVRIHERSPHPPESPMWYLNALKELERRGTYKQFSATVEVPDSLLRFHGKSRSRERKEEEVH